MEVNTCNIVRCFQLLTGLAKGKLTSGNKDKKSWKYLMSIDIVFVILLSYSNRYSMVQRAENEPPVYATWSRKRLAKAP